jgi:large subunit ribosomal protein L21
MTTYAIISLGGKQYRVQEGQRLLVDRLPYGESATFHPTVLFLGGDGRAEVLPQGAQVTAKVTRNLLGDKIRIGKYRPKTGYRRHRGHRSRLTEIEIVSVTAEAPARAQGGKVRAQAGGTSAAERPRARRKRTQTNEEEA